MNTSNLRGHFPSRKSGASRPLQIFLALTGLLIAQNCGAWHFSGVVWYDNNRNGVLDPGETAAPGVTVQVRNCTNNTLLASATTAVDGSFSFTDATVPLLGDYHVAFTNLPPGYVFTQQIYPPPTNGTVVSTVDPLTGFAPCFTFDQLTNATLNNAGICRAVTTTASALTPLFLCPGDNGTFFTVASGTGPFTYAWRKDGVLLAGQTASNLVLTAVAPTNAGLYSVEVRGFIGSVTNSAALTVSTNVTITPLTSQTVCPGGSASFSTTASGTGPFAYVWKKDGAVLAGQTSNSLILAGVSLTNAGVYAVEVNGACHSATNSATLTVNTNTSATPLTSQAVCPGGTATFSTVASGTGPFSYVWRKDGALLSGQTMNGITIASAASTNAGIYSVEVSGSCNTATNSATLTINTNTAATALTSQMVCPGGAATFSTIASGTGPFSYVWRKDGTLLTGRTMSGITIASVASTNAGAYSVEVSGSCNTVTNTAMLTVSTNTTATALTSQVVCPGGTASFSTIASGTGPFSYVWRKDGILLPGQTLNGIAIASADSTNAGTYSVEVSGSCNTVTNTATLTVSTNTSATPLSNQVVCPGGTANFSTIASGTGPFSYVWLKDGVLLPGQTGNGITTASADSTNAGTYSVEVSGSCNTVTNSATLTVNTNTSATPLTSQVVCPGGAATFSTVASGTGPFSYVWRKDGTLLPGQTLNGFAIAPVDSTNAGAYSVEVSGSCNTVTNTAALTVNTNAAAAPLTSQVVCPGGAATFSTIASGTGPFGYVWLKDGALLPGQTGNGITIASADSTNAGTYSVEVSGSCNTVTNSATLTVNTNTSATPLTNQVACPGGTVNLSTIASGTGPFSYVWRKDGTLLSGQTLNGFTIAPVDSTNAGTYSVEVSGSCNTVTNSATLTVNTNTAATPLTSQVVCPGGTATFSTAGSGTGPFSYVWRKDGTLLPGQTLNGFTIVPVDSTNAGTYSVEVSGACNTVTNSATLTVNTNTSATPLTSQVVCPGGAATFSTVASGTGPFSYVWRKDGTLLPGQTMNGFTIAPVDSTNAGAYSVEVSGSCNTVTNSATLTVNTNVTATALASLTKTAGDSATFTTTAAGTGPFTYLWSKDGSPLPGQTTNSLIIPSVTTDDAGVYAVAVGGACETITNSAELTVNMPTLVASLAGLTVCPGDPASFSAQASGTGPFSYVWRKDGNLLAGQTNSTLFIAAVAPTNAGVYAVEVTGAANSMTNFATLTVNTPVSASSLNNLVSCPGSTAAFSTLASGTGPFGYAWRLNGILLAGQTTNSLVINAVNATNAGTYSVEITGACGSVTNSAILTVSTNVTATPLASLIKNAGDPASFTTTASGTGPFAYVWRKDGTLQAGQTGSSLAVASMSAASAGVYSVEVSGACNTVTNSATLTLDIPPTVSILNPTNGATFVALANLTILAQAQDVYSTITSVEFYQGTNDLGGTTAPAPPYFIPWTNVVPGNYTLTAVATDSFGAKGTSAPVSITVVDQAPAVATGPPKFNPQIDMFVQTVNVTNLTYYTYQSVRLLVGNLPAGVQVYNASGATNGVPFIQSLTSIAPGGTVSFVVEYFVPNRVAPNPTYSAQLVSPLSQINVSGPSVRLNRLLTLPDKTMMVEFNTLSNRVYYVQYSPDMVTWKTATPAVMGMGGIIDWIDNGQPSTDAAPCTQACRYYRVILLP